MKLEGIDPENPPDGADVEVLGVPIEELHAMARPWAELLREVPAERLEELATEIDPAFAAKGREKT